MSDITRGDVLSMYVALESRGPSESEYRKYLEATNINSPEELLAEYRSSSVSKFPEFNSEKYSAYECPLDADNGKAPGTHAWHMDVIERIYNNAFNKTIFGRQHAYDTKEEALSDTSIKTNIKIAGADVNDHKPSDAESTYLSTHYAEIPGDNPINDCKYTLMNVGNLPISDSSSQDFSVGQSMTTSTTIKLASSALSINNSHWVVYKYDNWGGKYWAESLTKGTEHDLNRIVSTILIAGYTDNIENEDENIFSKNMKDNAGVNASKKSFILTKESTPTTATYMDIVPNSSYIDEISTPDEQPYIPVAVNANVISGVSSEASIVRMVADEDTKALALGMIMPQPMDYQKEYGLMYNNVVNIQMKAMRNQLSDLFELIDKGDTEQVPTSYDADGNPIPVTTDTTNNSDKLTIREKLSLKKDAYMQVLAQVNNNANSSTLSVLDKTKKFKYELDVAASQAHKLASEVKLTESKREVMEQQVVDNRRIKAMASLGDTYGTMMAGGLIPTSVMWAEYFRLGKELTLNGAANEKLMQYRGSWRPASTTDGIITEYTTEPKYFTEGTYQSTNNYKDGAENVGNYWIVDLSDWNLTAPLTQVYLGRVTNPGSGTHNADGTLNSEGDYVTNPNAGELHTYTSEDGVTMATTNTGEQILSGLVGTIKPAAKVDIANSLCSISLDGINYWRSGDIVYVEEIKTGNKSVTNAYRRVAGFSNGTTVTTAPEATLNDDTGIN